MKFRIKVKRLDDGHEWWESYEEDTPDPQKWAEEIVAWFNSALKPNESGRKLLCVEVVGDCKNVELLAWEKDIKGMSVYFRGSCVDIMYCKRCGITGKKFGLSGNIKIDSKFKKKVFRKCNTAREALGRW